MPAWLWILLVVLYLTALIVLGVFGLATLREGHIALFWFGILFPFLWIVGALMQPTPRAAAAEARANLRRASTKRASTGRSPPAPTSTRS